MRYDDEITIVTPEGVDLTILLAGLGSRFVARFIDSLIQGGIFLVIVLGLGGLGAAVGPEAGPAPSGAAVVVVFIVFTFLLFYAYDILFETLGSGRTPGKRAAGIRVVRAGGQPVGLSTSAVRNLVRLVDFLPTMYVIGVISILVSARNQRLGDMAAGTLVVRDRRGEPGTAPGHSSYAGSSEEVAPWDVSAVTTEEVATVRSFLERRTSLTPEARWRLAWELAQRLRPKVAGAPADLHPEVFLERLSAAKATRS